MSPSSPPTRSNFLVSRTNTILYCTEWADNVAFYRDVIGLQPAFENDWFVEFELAGGAHLSVADTTRATIAAGGGAGITLSWQVANLEAVRHRLVEQGVSVSEPTNRWGGTAVFLHDPEGNRIELWSPSEETEG